jgi:putrescine transport system permease protein
MVNTRGIGFSRFMLITGLLFLYLPMFVLVVYSFNASRLVSVWAGFSTQWYGALFEDQQILSAVWMSLRIAFYAASMAVCLGTLCAFVVTRFKRMRGRTLLSAMISAPLVMPEVITGLSLLLLFVQLAELTGWPADRGMVTIWIAHTTFCSAYVAVVVSARLREVDRSIEEAAMDLGCTPLKTFFVVTLPVITPALASGWLLAFTPALASGWLLAFTLSLDDLVIASFVSGPGATTLPMVVFSSVRMGVSPKINALATLIILAVSLVAFVAWYIMRRNEKRRRSGRFS